MFCAKFLKYMTIFVMLLSSFAKSACASEIDLNIPYLDVPFDIFGFSLTGVELLSMGLIVCCFGMLIGFALFFNLKNKPVHSSMSCVSETIYETCKTYMKQQAKLLFVLECFVGACIFYYFFYLNQTPINKVLNIFLWSVLGILGSFCVAWFGMRINTYANARTSFAALKGKAYEMMRLPLRSGMSIGVLLICVELLMMIVILLYVPRDYAGACFVGFAIGESLGAAVLRICGGIFTKIADIGADLMKIIFKIDEDDARNPGVIADCTGDNAGDSVGPTADGFETYGVTGVALISFIVLGVGMFVAPSGKLLLMPNGVDLQARLITWIFTMRVLMIVTSIFSFSLNGLISKIRFQKKENFDFEAPLTSLVWVSSFISILMTFAVSYMMIDSQIFDKNLWWKLSVIISCGTLASALIPEFTKIFTSAKSKHVEEVVNASREAGSSLNVISGIVAGNFSAFWQGLIIVFLMLIAYLTALTGLDAYMVYPTIFAFGLVAFGMLGMGPVTIAVDSYGPVADNAQSVFELSQIEEKRGVVKDIEKNYGFKPNFERGKYLLEENDSAGNTFKATAKPVLIGTAVIGATCMIFSIILLLNLTLDLLDPNVLFGIILGGAVIYWFSGASMQAVAAGAYKAVNYIKKHIKLNTKKAASIEDSKKVVRICTQYAQKGMFNIFMVIFSLTIAFAFFNASLFASYLIAIAVFGLFQALYMANAGGAWDNAKKVVEVDLKEKGTDLHSAVVVGDTVGDPYKDTSSVALNPIIKFTTLFGLLAVEMAAKAPVCVTKTAGIFFLCLGLVFVWRSFYKMRIEPADKD